ncbi:hypothetical protein M8J76_013493 [Diaphorina citri]|nr:hypothetical protein M8J75_006363 [Diaphorina citri]KAI5733581.1 hypothetical protein M8J76_013493 [Diaphorina citri]KAI5738264.1 hypothetical protein M8J77_004776 [Diaphorina citri]
MYTPRFLLATLAIFYAPTVIVVCRPVALSEYIDEYGRTHSVDFKMYYRLFIPILERAFYPMYINMDEDHSHNELLDEYQEPTGPDNRPTFARLHIVARNFCGFDEAEVRVLGS